MHVFVYTYQEDKLDKSYSPYLNHLYEHTASLMMRLAQKRMNEIY